MNRRWTAERDEQLRKLAADGMSASAIAMELGRDFTRNMVIGRASRIGISLGAGRKPRMPPRRPARRHKPSLAPVVARVAVPAAPEPPGDHCVTIEHLRFPISQCRWIDGKATADAVYCGARTKPGRSWCDEHHARTWAQPRKRSAA